MENICIIYRKCTDGNKKNNVEHAQAFLCVCVKSKKKISEGEEELDVVSACLHIKGKPSRISFLKTCVHMSLYNTIILFIFFTYNQFTNKSLSLGEVLSVLTVFREGGSSCAKEATASKEQHKQAYVPPRDYSTDMTVRQTDRK